MTPWILRLQAGSRGSKSASAAWSLGRSAEHLGTLHFHVPSRTVCGVCHRFWRQQQTEREEPPWARGTRRSDPSGQVLKANHEMILRSDGHQVLCGPPPSEEQDLVHRLTTLS